ncbi:hypothetical protein FACS1894200_05030 [Spirochaetia bacterium]|nr:hypothetical protein FACS1894200_05030 [Spirochaetia bacterium]
MSNWQQKTHERLEEHLLKLLKEAVKSGPIMNMDETTVEVCGEEGRANTTKSYLWLARGGPPGKPVSIYQYHPTRAGEHIKSFLNGFDGYLQTDGYPAYDSVLKEPKYAHIIHVGCFVHARRYFFEASKVIKNPKPALEGKAYIDELYSIEQQLREKDLPLEQFRAQRKEAVLPVFAAFHAWLVKQQSMGLIGRLAAAVNYTLNQWEKLIKYIESPYLTPDNNLSENGIRPLALGRKNWMFFKSPDGAMSGCTLYSLIETAEHNELNPQKYLTYLFEHAPYAKSLDDWIQQF